MRACVLSSYYVLDRRTAPSDRTVPKLCTHVRIYSLTSTTTTFDPPHPGAPQGGLGGYLFSVRIFVRPYFRPIIYLTVGPRRRTAPCPNFARMCGYIVSPQKKNLTHPTPGGFRGLYIVENLSRRIPPKFGTHVRIDTLTLKKKLTHPTPGGFRGLYTGLYC